MKNILEDNLYLNDCVNESYDLVEENYSCSKSLSSKVNYIEFDLTGFSFLNNELSNKTTYKIAKELANAIDKNSVSETKLLKEKYGNTKEFCVAKDYLNKKCKEVWDVFDNKNQKLNPPKDAMKILGITNIPSLDFLLADSVKYYQKSNDSTTVNIIKSIITNPNLDYSFADVYKYLKQKHMKEKCNYNFITVKFLASELDYNQYMLTYVGVDKNLMKEIYKSFSFISKLKYFFKFFVYNVNNENRKV